MIFQRISADKMISFRELVKFLHRLEIIGTVRVRSERIPLTDFGKPSLFSLYFVSYDPSTKKEPSDEDQLDLFLKTKKLRLQDIYNE